MFAFVFPGQGSQAVGMGQEIYEAFPVAREVFQEIDETLKQKLGQLIFQGPFETLTLTENAQPALMAVSLALMRVLTHDAKLDLFKKVTYVAGHSLGEYSALASAEALTLSQTARLLKLRGKAMQQAVSPDQGGMVALLGADLVQAEEIALKAAEGQVCEIANDNAPGQIVISGHQEAIMRATELAREAGIKRVIPLPVSAPFHCSLMQPAAKSMEEALAKESFNQPLVPVVSNVRAEAETVPGVLKALLVQQVTGRVRWRESVLKLKELGITSIVEIGAGKVLTGLTKRIVPELEAFSLNTPADIDLFIQRF
ncbi:malonyl CoA-acyl carrier protein transacylase [Caedimonas varicaedens]|jgi:[acyl-carrier-protein] S-malonyltransferase|uniref:Malonyl CoA-acyl carrier protein transacylase n=1 Tax=Caedimonas varicaedens TaxID=1629334 RepID=A0A0K8MCE4_9PROT|nr:malonyl CoA-acyl carrier protein transacylase [Caedimonas varicaedens]